ncbi:Ubiquitin domain-containing protein ubfd1 [Tritrichomonas musculus]|uniref:Ubiquitin domain-containing protein ubfd1 n=1 Tax=Tritrichomonas musculus TaxID=1915356 RepID=A0ABR2JZ70_9EUKA
MQIILRYKNTSYTLNFNTIPSMSQLKKEISNKTQVDPKFQKIIYKGKVISTTTAKVSKLDIKEGSRLFLISTSQNEEPNMPRVRSSRKQVKVQQCDLKDQILDPEIVDKGPPPGCEKGIKNVNPKFPKDPFIIYDTKGNTSQMAIETDSIWINQIVKDGNKGDQDRIFYSDITDFKITDIDKYKTQYSTIFLSIKKADNTYEVKKFYFIPYQYSNAFQNFLSNNRNQ